MFINNMYIYIDIRNESIDRFAYNLKTKFIKKHFSNIQKKKKFLVFMKILSIFKHENTHGYTTKTMTEFLQVF